MIAEKGEKIHVMTRRQFDNDLRRHFAGEIVDIGESVLRVEGHAFILDTGSNKYIRRPSLRTRIISMTDAKNVINILPAETDLNELRYVISKEGRLVLTDGENVNLDINEFGATT